MTFRKPLPFLLSIAFLIVACTTAAHADDASKKEKAEQLFALMHMEQTYGQLMTQLTDQTDQMTRQILPDEGMTEEQRTQLTVFKGKVNKLLTDTMSWTVLEPDYVKLYADTYTEEDLDGIIAFYRSPVGQKMLSTTPTLLKASSSIAMTHMGTVEPKLRQMMDEFAQQVKPGQGSKSQ